jgi:hypothetical protein
VARKRAYLHRRAGLSALLEDSVCCGASGNSFIRGMAPSGVLVLAESRRGPHPAEPVTVLQVQGQCQRCNVVTRVRAECTMRGT